ncbi:MAG: TRAP transporter substrate-binding protein [Bacillota bacterium]|nr:TRAP transporter substrate-binding protein [Bacillota bacterium]
MKKFLVLLLAFCCFFALAACAPAEEPAPAEDESVAETPAEPIVIKISHVENENDALQVTSLMFEEYVEEQTNGGIDVQVYPNSELASDEEALQGILLGTVEMAIPNCAIMESYQPSFGITNMPFIFKDDDSMYAALDGGLGERLAADAAQSGFRVLGFANFGHKCFSNSVRPIETPADMAGLDIRVMNSPLLVSTMQALGANPTPMAFGELYTALQQGAVDGQENPISIFYDYKFYEVQQYLSLTYHGAGIGVVTIGEEFFNSLSPEYQAIVEEGARLYLVEEQRRIKTESMSQYLDMILAEGITVTEISEENRQLFIDAVQPVYEQFEATIGADIFELAQQ